MPHVKGKVQLCSCENYNKYFKSVQGLGGHSLFDRYPDIDNVVNKIIEAKYRHFLAQPEVDGDSITWFSKPFNETPQRISELQGEELEKYEQIKRETLAHYQSVTTSLKQQNKNSEAECLEKATKFVNDDFVYCYDGKTVLGIWGMQLKENIREPLGIAMKNLFVEKKKKGQLVPEPPIIDETQLETPIAVESPPVNPFKVRFKVGDSGTLDGNSEYSKHSGETLMAFEVPTVVPKDGYEFIGWDEDPKNYSVNGDKVFTAQYREKPQAVVPLGKLPWWRRFWLWFTVKGCLKWLLWLLLLLLLLLLFCWLFRECNSNTANPIPYPIGDKPFIHDDPRSGSGGIYNPGDPYEPVPTPPEYGDVLPPNQGVMPPMDTTKIIRVPGNPVIIGNRLNVLMENEDKSIMDLAKDFKEKYPDDKYKVVYYDDVVKRMQIEVPEEDRARLKTEIPSKFAPEYELFVFDEALFESGQTPNDPAFADPDKSWYLKEVKAPQAWETTKGNSNGRKLTIAIVDNGFSLRHPELQSKVVMPYNVWEHSKNVTAQRVDHGTHVAGTALAIADNGKGLCGIAPECAFMPVQVANKQGLMTTTSILDGILYALYQGADVINVSLGTTFAGTPPENVQRDLQDNHFKEEERVWNEVMKIANKHRVVIIIAAGNDNMLAGVDPMNRPKNFIVVSAVDKNNSEYRKAGFSNFGDYSTVSAPGVSIFSTVGNSDYAIMDGTSMASPIVAGAVALMKSLNEGLTTEQIICVLKSTGKPAKGKIGNLVQIDKAVDKVKSGDYTDCDSRTEAPSTGDVQVLLSWNNYNDLDLVCIDPNNETVWFRNKRVSSGGELEIDMNVDYPDSQTPIENIFWQQGGAPNGTYSVFLLYYKKHTTTNETPYKITVKYGNKTEEFSGTIKREGDSIPICTFTLGNVSNPQNPDNPSTLPTRDRRNELQRKRDELQRQLNEIDRQLQGL